MELPLPETTAEPPVSRPKHPHAIPEWATTYVWSQTGAFWAGKVHALRVSFETPAIQISAQHRHSVAYFQIAVQ